MAMIDVECDNEECVNHQCGECRMEIITIDEDGCCEDFERRKRQ